ncbi:MAG: tRNA preQ1(34) S-adenosylmethionine ribosyltransferase-isomerase QueA [bacterium]
MKVSDFDYNLPAELIAQVPMKPRDHSRLLILDKNTGEIAHQKFYNIINYLNEGDVLVLNNSKVIPARLIGQKETGGEIEIFLVKKQSNPDVEIWECLVRGKVRPGMIIDFENDLMAEILSSKDQTWLVRFNKSGADFMKAIQEVGQVPLPPYIKKELTDDDKQDYQTVYADDNQPGSVAAPTAGFHFTNELLEQIKNKGVKIEYLTLHVGLGTFLPVKTEKIKDHHMHAEWVEVKKETIQTIEKAKRNQNKIIAVGTTSCRSLEAVWQNNNLENDFADWVDIFIYPGYDFKIVDSLITNFHLPKSTLLMLVSALAKKENIDKAYQEAIQKKYRFYSYGDAMLII